MNIFTVDYSNAGEGKVTPGIYEVFVSEFRISKTTTGKESVSLFYQIRNDVQQKHQNGKIQYDNFVVDENVKWKFDSVAKAAGIPDGTQFSNAEQWGQSLVNKDLKVKVEMGEPNKNGNSYPEVKSYYPSDQPTNGRSLPGTNRQVANNGNPMGMDVPPISDDDLPF